jgi:hypothetical protein
MILDSPFKSIIENVLKKLQEALEKTAYRLFDE